MGVRAISKYISLGICIVSLMIFWNQFVIRHDAAWIPAPAERGRKIDARAYRMMTLGHWTAALDWLMVRFLIEDPAYSHVAPGTHPPSYDTLDLATDLDPAFYDLYTTGANYLSVVRNDAPGALHLLKKAEHFRTLELPSWPHDFREQHWSAEWYVPMLLGYVHLYEMENLPEAAEAFRVAGRLSGAPRYLQDLSQRLAQPGGEYEVGIRLLRFMLISEKNEPTRVILEKKLQSLLVGKYLDNLNRQVGTLPKTDPWGGKIFMNEKGRIVSTTAREKVLGLE